MPNVAAINRREYLKFEAQYQVKEEKEKPKQMSAKQRKKQLVDIYTSNPIGPTTTKLIVHGKKVQRKARSTSITFRS